MVRQLCGGRRQSEPGNAPAAFACYQVKYKPYNRSTEFYIRDDFYTE